MGARWFKLVAWILAASMTPLATATNFKAEVGFEVRAFPDQGARTDEQLFPAAWTELEWFTSWNGGDDALTLVSGFWWDAEDDERTHADLRELSWLHLGEGWELRSGVRRVFWGVAESQHLVDIINQSDLVLALDGEEKLGQPMVNLSVERPYGIFDFFLLSGFRERTFPGVDGRVGPPFPVDGAEYESDREEGHLSWALRWTHYIGDWNFAVSHFSGTSREPQLRPAIALVGGVPTPTESLVAHYPTIDQTGLEAQYLAGGWVWKLEAISRSGFFTPRYAAAVFGFEFTQGGVRGTRSDLGWVVEYNWDERGDSAQNQVFEQDVFVAARWVANDLRGTEGLLGVYLDPETRERVWWLEASRRLNSDWKLVVEGRAFAGGHPLPTDFARLVAALSAPDVDNKTGYLQQDDFVRFQLIRYF